jgi:hypothetical protein
LRRQVRDLIHSTGYDSARRGTRPWCRDRSARCERHCLSPAARSKRNFDPSGDSQFRRSATD